MDWSKFNTLEFDITNYCQAKCPLCPREMVNAANSQNVFDNTHMSVDHFKKVLDDIPSHIEKLFFCGDYGDPMMHPKIGDIIDLSIQKGLEVEISTNGALRKPEWYTEMGNKHGEKLHIVFAIDGINAEEHAKYRINVDFEKAWANFEAFSKTKAETSWQFIVFKYNVDSIPEAMRIAYDMGVKFHTIINYRPWGDNRITDPDKIKQINQWRDMEMKQRWEKLNWQR